MEGSPKELGGNFDCKMNLLKTLIGGPQEVGEFYDCGENQIVSLQGAQGR